eukprot:6005096-Heterocapsa_arctica.AAC.1
MDRKRTHKILLRECSRGFNSRTGLFYTEYSINDDVVVPGRGSTAAVSRKLLSLAPTLVQGRSSGLPS